MKTALFVDFDNVYSGLRRISADGAERFARQPDRWLRWLTEELAYPVHIDAARRTRRVLVRRCYLNPVLFHAYRRPFHEAGFEIVDCPPMTATGKTSTDIHLVLDTMDALLDATHFDEFIVFSADADFSPVLRRLRRHDRRTVVFAAGAMSESYKASADVVLGIPVFLREALELDDTEEVVSAPDSGRVPNSATDVELRNQAEVIVRGVVLEGGAPVALAVLAATLDRQLPELRKCRWAGAGSFGVLLRQLSLPGVLIAFSENLAYDQRRRNGAGLHDAQAEEIASRQEADLPAQAATPTQAIPAEPLSPQALDEAAAHLVRRWVAEAERPVRLSSLGQALKQTFPQLASGWNGAPTLVALLRRLRLEPLQRGALEDGSTFVLYDPERHTVPAKLVADAMVAAMLHAAELPAMKALDLANVLHHSRTHMGGSEPFEIAKVSRSVNEALALTGNPVSARRVAVVLQGLIFGGLDASKVFSDDSELSAAAMGVILGAWSRETQSPATDEARQRLVDWLCGQERVSTAGGGGHT